MAVFGEGKCLYELTEECKLGGAGVEYNPIACLVCAILRLAEVVEGGLALEIVRTASESGN